MAIPHAKSGEVIDVRPLGSALAEARTTTLVKTMTLGIIHQVIPSEKDIPGYQVYGEITVQCLERRVACTVGNTGRDLSSEESYSLHNIEDA